MLREEKCLEFVCEGRERIRVPDILGECSVHSYRTFRQAAYLTTIMTCPHNYCTFPQAGHHTSIMHCAD